MKKFIATYVQTGNTSDGRPHIFGVFDTKKNALYDVEWDMEDWYENTRYGKDLDCDIDYDKLTAKIGDIERIYNIEEVKI